MGPPTPMPGAVLGARGEAGGPGQCWRVGDTGGGPGDGDGGRGITESLGAMLRGQGMMLGGQGQRLTKSHCPPWRSRLLQSVTSAGEGEGALQVGKETRMCLTLKHKAERQLSLLGRGPAAGRLQKAGSHAKESSSGAVLGTELSHPRAGHP